MDKKCNKCKKVVSADDFLCPYCGAILGDDMVFPGAASEKKRGKKRPVRQSLRLVCVIALLSLAIFAACFLWKCFQSTQAPDTVPPATDMPQTTAPLTVYNIQIKSDGRNTFEGVSIHIIKDGQELYTCVSGQYGKASIILPEFDGYSIRVSGLPTEYQLAYNDTIFPFAPGQRELVVVLDKKPVPYNVTVVNEDGEPLPNTCIAFVAFGKAQQKMTDENGCCVFDCAYSESGIHAEIIFAPTGYYVRSKIISFNGTTKAEVVLKKFTDLQLHDSHCLYSVQVIDEYADPVSDLYLNVSNGYQWWDDLDYEQLGYYLQTSGRTNQDGWFTFIGYKDQEYSIYFPQNPDYSHIPFRFDEGSTHQQIQLELHMSEFTYTIEFVNQYDEPVPGVEIAVKNRGDFEEPMSYTSDENGIISFQSKEPDPTVLLFWVKSGPDGYDPETMYDRYYFSAYSRIAKVELTHQTTITVVDDAGVPIPGAVIRIEAQMIDYILTGETNEKGQCFFFLPTENEIYKIEVVSLPEGYVHLVFAPFWMDGLEREFVIKPLQYYPIPAEQEAENE